MPINFKGKDIVSVADLSKAEILAILRTAKILKQKPRPGLLAGKILASCFFEPSTRTRLSFEAAMQRLGGSVIGFADPQLTSIKKHETLYDTIKIIGQYADAIVIRHPLDGAARQAAAATDKPVINAGDGSNQHPTQTLTDLFTISESHGALDALNIVFVGDLKYGRTVHSLTQALTHFKVRLFYVAPDSLQLPGYLLDILKQNRIKFSLHRNVEEVLPTADILYLTRIQEERFSDPTEFEKVRHAFRLTASMLTGARKNMKVLHPLPRVNELDITVDTTPYANYFTQAANGVPVREAILGLVLGKL